jgi:hypothetical protein
MRFAMDAALLRRQFAEYCGADLYHRFVRSLNTTGRSKQRLLYWQEETWRAFAELSPEATELAEGGYAAIASLFHVCDVHDCELASERASVVYGLVCFSDAYLDARNEEFPFANPVAYGGCVEADSVEVDLEFCPECRRRLEAWRQEHAGSLEAHALAAT